MAEVLFKRTINSKTYDQGNGLFKFVAGLSPLHFGVANDSVDFNPIPTTIPLDGWKVNQADYTYSLGKKSGQDGWFGFGGRQGQNTIFFRLARMGYIHWPTRAFDNISGAPTYDRANLSNNVETFDTGEEVLPVGLKASWGNIWNTPNNGEVSIDVSANGERLKLDVILNQAGREWIAANRPPSTAIAQTYFGMVFQLDLTDIPKIVRNGIEQGDDFDDIDGLPTELRDSLDNLLAFMPVDYAYAGEKDNEQKIKLTKRFWLDGDGNHYLLVGAKVADINSLPAGDIRFDPTFGAAQIAIDTRDGQEANDATWAVSGADSDGNRLGNQGGSPHDMGMSWDNVTIAAGSTISSATIELSMKYNNLGNASDIVTRMQGFNVDDVAVFSATNRPSQIAQTTALVDRTYTSASDWIILDWLSCDDASAIIQEIIDRGGWASGQALGVVLKDNGSALNNYWQLQDYGRNTTLAAKITIVYTVGAPTGIEVFRRRMIMKKSAGIR